MATMLVKTFAGAWPSVSTQPKSTMFREAYKIASGFTAPVIISRKTIAGDCSSGIGAFVVVNQEGWIVTAAHILDQFQALMAECEKSKQVASEREAIESDATLSDKDKRKKIGKLKYPPKPS